MPRIFIVMFALAFGAPALAEQDGPEEQPQADVILTDEARRDIDAVLASGLAKDLLAPKMHAFGPKEAVETAKKMKEAHRTLKTDNGDPAIKYDVVLQPGHYPRISKPGEDVATGGEGKYVTEQEVAAYVTGIVANELKAQNKNLRVVIVPADGFQRPLRTKIFVAFHTDAYDKKKGLPCDSSASVGYPDDASGKAMHYLALAVATTLDEPPKKFMEDNFTGNLRDYYAYKHMTDGVKGLVEMSELTCPADEERLLARADVLGRNLAWGILYHLKKPVP